MIECIVLRSIILLYIVNYSLLNYPLNTLIHQYLKSLHPPYIKLLCLLKLISSTFKIFPSQIAVTRQFIQISYHFNFKLRILSLSFQYRYTVLGCFNTSLVFTTLKLTYRLIIQNYRSVLVSKLLN